MKRRRFTPDFKRSIVEQLLSEAAGPAEICRCYNLSSGQLYTWKKQYAQGHFDPEPSREAELVARVAELERMLGKVTMENEFLKKAVRNSLKQTQKKESVMVNKNRTQNFLHGGISVKTQNISFTLPGRFSENQFDRRYR